MIVVTGGAGFIGSAIIWKLNKNGEDDILVVDSLGSSDKWRNLVNLKFKDYIDKDKFVVKLEEGIFSNEITGIIHMGAQSDTTEKDADFLIRNNYEYTKRLTLWSIKNNKRFVYASSAATYGDGNGGFSDNLELLPKLKPLNLYGEVKHLFDLWALRNGYLEKIAGLKYFNAFGPNEYHKAKMRSVVLKAFEQIRAIKRVKLFKSYNSQYKDGRQLRDFVYVKDVVDMTLFIFNNPEANGIFNIGTGCARSFYDLTMSVFNAMKLRPNIEYIPMPEQIHNKYQYFTQAEMGKIKSLGYNKNTHSLEDAISDYVKNYLTQKNPYLKP